MAELLNGSARRGPDSSHLVPLAERVLWLTWMRCGLAVLVVATGLLLRIRHDTTLLTVVGALLVASIAFPLVVRRSRRWAVRTAVNASLVLDGVSLALLVHTSGGLQGPGPVLVVVHASAISLLASFRTGVKVAVWHCLAVLVILQCEVSGLLPVVGGWSGRDYLAFSLTVVLTTLATSTFAAVNERELRRRRHDAELLRRLALALETAGDRSEISSTLARTCVDGLGAVRGVVLLAAAGRLERLDVVTWPAGPTTPTGPVGSAGDSPLLVRATREGVPLLTRRCDPVVEGFLPGSGTVVVVPVPAAGGEAWLLLDLGKRRRVEHRLLDTAVQAAAHAGQALGRALLVEELRRTASTDGLTGVANRAALDEFLRDRLGRASADAPCSVALVDLDHFKRVNDTHGHLVGDEVLRTAARALLGTAREGDLVGRYGGEEFAVVLTGGPDDAVLLADRLRRAVADCDAPVPVTCSIGVATSEGGTDVATLLRAADEALYRAKDHGRNRVEVSGRSRAGVQVR